MDLGKKGKKPEDKFGVLYSIKIQQYDVFPNPSIKINNNKENEVFFDTLDSAYRFLERRAAEAVDAGIFEEKPTGDQ